MFCPPESLDKDRAQQMGKSFELGLETIPAYKPCSLD
jgi:hypothetical protein